MSSGCTYNVQYLYIFKIAKLSSSRFDFNGKIGEISIRRHSLKFDHLMTNVSPIIKSKNGTSRGLKDIYDMKHE